MNKYFIAIGTSHTDGDCDGKLSEKVWCDYLAEQLNVSVLRHGISGAENLDFLQVINELETKKLLNENCVGIILEPRTSSVQTYVPHEWYVDETCTNFAQNRSYENLIGITTWNDEKQKDRNKNYGTGIHPLVINRHLHTKISAFTNTEQNYKNGYPFPDSIGDETDPHFDTAIGRVTIKKCIQSLEWILNDYHNTQSHMYHNYSIICAIKNIAKFKRIPFRWFEFENQKQNWKFTSYQDYDKEVDNTYIDLKNMYPSYYNDNLKCGCGHLNQSGHVLLAKELKKHLAGNWLRL